MKTYEKIETIYARNIEGTKKLIPGKFRNETVEFLKDNKWVWTEKVDGCLRSNTKISCTDGSVVTIGEIVNQKLPVEVYGYEDGKVVASKVIGWHYNGETDEWYKIKVSRRGLGTKGNTYQNLICTANHKLFVDGDYKRADELHVGDRVMFIRNGQSMSYQQEQIVIGMLIGDGSAADEYRSVEFSQVKAHEGYVDWLLGGLGSIAGNKQKVRISGYGSEIIPARTVSCTQVEQLSRQFYVDGKKIIPKGLKLSPISLAILYMDDGSLSRSINQIDRCTIALNDYDEASVDNLVQAIQEQLHMQPVKYMSKGWNLRFNTQDANVFQTLVAPYICECMQYKLSAEYRGKFAGMLPNSLAAQANEAVEMEILDIEKQNEVHERYDITTETHNYFANGVLVHNCNIRVLWDGHSVTFGGRTERAQIPAPLVNRLNELFGGEQNAQVFEQMFGEREVLLFGEGYGAKIQNGGAYIPNGVDFIMFDLLINDNYQSRENMEGCAKALGIKVVPIVGEGTLEEAVEYVKGHPQSTMGGCEMEGVVCRPAVELRDRCGNRMIVKIKWNDFKGA